MFEGSNCREDFGIVPVLDDGSNEEFSNFDAGVPNCEFGIKEKLGRLNPRLRVRIRIEQARAKRELPPDRRSRNRSAINVMKDPEVPECLSGPIC